MTMTRFPHGISSMGMPVLGSGGTMTTGNVYFVDDGGSDSNSGKDKDQPFATVDYAIGKCTANQGDIIIVMPGHAETTTAIAADVAGISIIGLGHGAKMPTLTATTGASDLIDVTAASFYMENMRLVGAASGCTGLMALSAAADDIHLNGCKFESPATPVEQIRITPGANCGLIEYCLFKGTAAGTAASIIFECSLTGVDNEDWIIRFCDFNYIESAGCDDAAINVSTSSGGVTGILIQDCNFLGLAAGDHAVDPQEVSTGRATGMAVRCFAHGADSANAFVQSDLLGYVDCTGVEAGTRGAWNQPVATPAEAA